MKSTYNQGSIFINGLNRETGDKVLLYINDKIAAIKNKNYSNSRGTTTEQFWALEVGDYKNVIDIKPKPLELYVNQDTLNVLGYQKENIVNPNRKPDETRKNNEYRLTRKNIYSEQVYLPCEEYLVMNNVEIFTLIKVF